MLNQDINSRFQDWLLSPSEALDFEVKGWLDLQDHEARAAIAKALIALENHGGGFLLMGYQKDGSGALAPQVPRPSSLATYGPDEINSIVKRFAEPSFHVDVTLQTHPTTNEQFPLCIVRGASRVPVRAERASAAGTIKKDAYYIRRPGPASETPQSGAEWDALVRRCVMNQRQEIIETLRAFVPPAARGNVAALVDTNLALNNFVTESYQRWVGLDASLPADHPAKNRKGTYSFACQFEGDSKKLSPVEILGRIEGLTRYTGWPTLVVLHGPETAPYLAEGCIEAWTAKARFPDPAHADFWRVHQDGFVYLVRGYQEDALEGNPPPQPGKLFDLTLPVWRAAEFLLRAEELGRQLFEAGFSIRTRFEWRGLQGRELTVLSGRRLMMGGRVSQQDYVKTEGVFSAEFVVASLPEVVEQLVGPLFPHFSFFQPPHALYREEIERMRRREF